MPLFDLINHSNTPNVAIRPYSDKTTNQSYLVLDALKDINENDQLTVNYGQLSNMHYI